MEKKTLHLIGNAHIDPVWLWQWQEGFHEVKASFRSALDRMNTFDDFVFVASSAAFYNWVEQSDPAMFAEIQQRVAEGRWGIVGGWWIEPDCNIPSGESFVRHGLYAQRYFLEKFGVTAKTGFNIDSFGHAGTLPQILQLAGIENYVFLRPGPHEMDLPGRLFTWEAPDGSRVTAFQIPYTYAACGDSFEDHLLKTAAEITEPVNEWMSFVGVGNHGGGPTVESIKKVHAMNDGNKTDAFMRYSTPELFFEHVQQSGVELPVVPTELQHHASGCYSVHSAIKQWNRKAENALIAAEKWSVLAHAALKQEYPTDFSHAWKQLLFNQFHDIMAGTSLEEAYDDARSQIGEAISIAERNQNLAYQAFAWNINIPEQPEAYPVVVFNPLTWPITATIELESSAWAENAVLMDEENNPLPHQAVRSHSTTNKKRLCFEAGLPALGYRTYRLVEQPAEAAAPQLDSPLHATQTTLENEFIYFELDLQAGTIARLTDKTTGLDLITGGGAKPVVLSDPGDTWAHGVFEWHNILGEFKPSQITLIENGPVKATIRVTSTYQSSQIVQDFTLSAHSNQIDAVVSVNWQEQLKMLKLQFPTTLQNGTVTAENAYGHVVRQPNGIEEPMQRWIDLTGISVPSQKKCGLAVLNDAKYSADVDENTISLTILRSPVYAHHDPTKLDPHGIYRYIDQGWQTFQYSLVPHDGCWKAACIVQKAEQLNQPPYALFATFHANGKLPQKNSFITVDSESVIVSAVKQSEDGQGFILRAVETHGKPTSAMIRLPKCNRTIEEQFKPGEIKTIYIPKEEESAVRLVNVLEM